MLKEYILTVYILVINHRWGALHTYFGLIREILAQPRMIITPGQPKDKEV